MIFLRLFVQAAATFAAGILALVLVPQFASATPTLQTLHAFCQNASCPDGKLPLGGLVADGAGNLFGTAFQGGLSSTSGVVFELVNGAGSFQYKLLHKFCSKHTQNGFCADGSGPVGELIEDINGNLYGATTVGGTFNAGEIYELIPNADRTKYTLFTLYSFCTPSCANGANPSGSLSYAGQQTGVVYDGVSPLFGTARAGGDASFGVAFRLDVAPGTFRRKETAIYSFCARSSCADGSTPSTLIVGSDGNLFGSAQSGGTGSSGVVFELSPHGKRFLETVLHDFCSAENCGDGRFPANALLQDAAGNLIGATQQGGGFNSGTLFKIVPHGATSHETVLYSFCSISGCLDGAFPQGRLTIDSTGGIVGTTTEGGTGDFTGGTVFRFKNTAFTTLYSFCAKANCADGKQPGTGAMKDAAGNLLGTTSAGGNANNGGTVFLLKP